MNATEFNDFCLKLFLVYEKQGYRSLAEDMYLSYTTGYEMFRIGKEVHQHRNRHDQSEEALNQPL